MSYQLDSEEKIELFASSLELNAIALTNFVDTEEKLNLYLETSLANPALNVYLLNPRLANVIEESEEDQYDINIDQNEPLRLILETYEFRNRLISNFRKLKTWLKDQICKVWNMLNTLPDFKVKDVIKEVLNIIAIALGGINGIITVFLTALISYFVKKGFDRACS